MDKKELRIRQINIRKNMDANIRAEEPVIQKHLVEFIKDKGYKKILVYVSTKEELDTTNLIEELLSMGISVYVPRVEGKVMQFYRIYSFDDLSKGYMGILEPKTDCRKLEPYAGEELLIVTPGLLFDREGNRLGYGGGYYDRYLYKCKEEKIPFFSLGLCFSPFLCTEGVIPLEQTDVRLDGLVTKEGIIYC